MAHSSAPAKGELFSRGFYDVVIKLHNDNMYNIHTRHCRRRFFYLKKYIKLAVKQHKFAYIKKCRRERIFCETTLLLTVCKDEP